MDYAEYMNAVNNNGVAEGISCKIFPQLVAGTEPFYRLYSTAATAHLYTASFSEVVNSVNNLGFKLEGIAGYIYKNDTCGGVPYYRLYHPPSTGSEAYVYTTSTAERDDAIQHLSYVSQGIAGYVVPA